MQPKLKRDVRQNVSSNGCLRYSKPEKLTLSERFVSAVTLSLKFHRSLRLLADPSTDEFLLSIAQRVMEVSWSNHGKFGALISLVRYLGSRPLLASQSDFPDTLLSQMQDQAVACHVSMNVH